MRHLIAILFSLILLFSLVGCGRGVPDLAAWQGQYDLGTRYLTEGNYEEAVIAFSAAIGIDPKQSEAYIGMAEAYIELGDYDKAAETVAQGREACGDSEEFDRILNEIAARQEAAEVAGQNGEDAAPDDKSAADLPYEEENDGTGLNAYGATLFTHRENYLGFADMTPEQQKLVETAGNAAVANDMDAMYGILNTVNANPFETGNVYNEIYTVWNGYKMKLVFRPYGAEDDMENFQGGRISVTLRPENGTGYYCEAQLSAYILDYGGGGNGHYEQWIVCPCVDWQWNGTLQCFGQNYSLSYNEEHITTREYTNTFSESGQIIDNLRDGIFIETIHAVENFGPNTKDDVSDSEYRTVFQNGLLVENLGNTINPPILKGTITVVGEIGDLEDQSNRDFLYW